MKSIDLILTQSEALVFFDWLSRFNQSDKSKETFKDQADQKILDDIECMLEKQLTETFAVNYDELLRKARLEIQKQ